MTLLEKLKLMLGLTDDTQEPLLYFLLDVSKQKILNKLYPYGYDDADVVPSRYEYNQLMIAVYFFNKRGAEGQLSHSENGISRTYESSDVPATFLRDVTPMVSVVK